MTAEVTPHHLMLTDEANLGYDTNTKVLPPLRGQDDREALREGLIDGTLDAIATDHAPHAEHEKETDFVSAPPGMIGLETALASVMPLVGSERISPLQLVRKLSTEPARILSISGGSLAKGAAADITLVAPEETWQYDSSKGYSKSRNSPWSGESFNGRVRKTFVHGRPVYDADQGILVP